MNLREALEAFLLVDRAESTEHTYREILSRFVTDVGPGRPIDLITPEDIDAYFAALRKRNTKFESHPRRPAEQGKLSKATLYKHAKTVKVFFNWLVRREHLQISPARFLTISRPMQPLGMGKAPADVDVGEMLGAARYKPRDWAIILLLVQSGCRRGEAAGLQLSTLDLDACEAVIDGKGAKRRRIYFGPETAEAIRVWLKRRPETKHDFVFTSSTGEPLTGQAIYQILKRRCQDADIEHNISPHQLRHLVALTLARNNTPLPVIQRYLGHSDASITMQYLTSLNDSDIDAARRLLSLNRGNKKNAGEDDIRQRFGIA